MVTYRWNVEFVLPGVWLERPVQIGKMNLQPASRDESTGSLILEIAQCLDIPAVMARAMQDIELMMISATAILGSVLTPRLTSMPRLANQQELEASGMPIPTPDPELVLRWDVMAPLVDEEKLAKGYRAAVHLPADDCQLLRLVARWLWKANFEQDPYDQMLALWISFNVLYGPLWAVTKDEREAIKSYATQRIPPPAATRLLSGAGMDAALHRLADRRLTLRKRLIGDELRTGLSQSLITTNPVELMKRALLSVYAVRCNLVHNGHVVLSRNEEVFLLWASNDVLKAVIMHALQTQLGLA